MVNWIDQVTNPIELATKTLDALKSVVEVRDQVKFGETIAKLYEQLLAAQRGALEAQKQEYALIEENRELRARLTQLDEGATEKARFEMRELPPGVRLYALKEPDPGHPTYYVCPTCYHRDRISPLQGAAPVRGVTRYRCNECKSVFEVGIREKVQVDRGRGGRYGWMSR